MVWLLLTCSSRYLTDVRVYLRDCCIYRLNSESVQSIVILLDLKARVYEIYQQYIKYLISELHDLGEEIYYLISSNLWI